MSRAVYLTTLFDRFYNTNMFSENFYQKSAHVNFMVKMLLASSLSSDTLSILVLFYVYYYVTYK